jgi:HAE1 family hydrophobic/amphiphilic exporter-1
MYGGLRGRNMRIWLEKQKLAAYGLDANDVVRALRAEHLERPAGFLESNKIELNVRTMGEAKTPKDFEDIPVLIRGLEVVRLRDVGVVEDGLEDRRSFSRFNSQPTVGIGVMRAMGANVVEVCQNVKDKMPEYKKMLPPGMELSISTDYSLFIIEDIKEVQRALFFGILLTAIVTFVFLGSIGTTLNVLVSIPTSLIGTFIAIRWMGFTINFMTLLALSLSVGVVVDDAILVLENIYRRREHGEGKLDAATKGAREISFAAIAATLSIVAIFVPVAFLKGSIGKFFFQFAITTTVAVMLSLVISLTVTPMLCAFFLNVRQMKRPMPAAFGGFLGPVMTLATRLHWILDRWILEPLFIRPTDWLMDQLKLWYALVLAQALRHQWWVIPMSLLLAASALLFVYGVNWSPPWGGKVQIKPIGRELVPSEDQSRLLVNIICPVGSSIDYVDDMLIHGENALKDLKDPQLGTPVVATYFSAVSIRPGALISEGILFVRLVPADERTATQTDIIGMIRKEMSKVPGSRTVVLDLSTQGFTAVRGYPVDFAVQGPEWQKVTRYAEAIRARMTDSALVTDVNSDFRPGMPEVHVKVDVVKATELSLPVQRIASNITAFMGGVRSGRFTDNERRYDVRVRLLEGQRFSMDQLEDLYFRSDKNKLIPARDVITAEVVPTLPVINRYNHARKIQITANTAPDVSQGEAFARCLEIAEELRDEMDLPTGYRIVPLGNAQAMQETLDSLWIALALGFIVASMILGVQFNSFVHPFTVLMAVPFGVTGALATLWLFGDRLNFMSMIGMVLLAGLVKKNSIILVDYTNQLRSEGKSLIDAVLIACPTRLRPILMTSLATIAAAIPLAFGIGPGAETRAPLARSIIGGSILSTLVTLIVVPLFYVLFDRFGAWVAKQAKRDEPAATPMPPAPELNGLNGTAGAREAATPTAAI